MLTISTDLLNATAKPAEFYFEPEGDFIVVESGASARLVIHFDPDQDLGLQLEARDAGVVIYSHGRKEVWKDDVLVGPRGFV